MLRVNYQKRYYEKRKKLIECPICKCKVVSYRFDKHIFTKKHIKNINENTKKEKYKI